MWCVLKYWWSCCHVQSESVHQKKTKNTFVAEPRGLLAGWVVERTFGPRARRGASLTMSAIKLSNAAQIKVRRTPANPPSNRVNTAFSGSVLWCDVTLSSFSRPTIPSPSPPPRPPPPLSPMLLEAPWGSSALRKFHPLPSWCGFLSTHTVGVLCVCVCVCVRLCHCVCRTIIM